MFEPLCLIVVEEMIEDNDDSVENWRAKSHCARLVDNQQSLMKLCISITHINYRTKAKTMEYILDHINTLKSFFEHGWWNKNVVEQERFPKEHSWYLSSSSWNLPFLFPSILQPF